MSNRISGQMPPRAVATPTAYTSNDADKIAELEARVKALEDQLVTTVRQEISKILEDVAGVPPAIEVTADTPPISTPDVTGGIPKRKPAAKADKA